MKILTSGIQEYILSLIALDNINIKIFAEYLQKQEDAGAVIACSPQQMVIAAIPLLPEDKQTEIKQSLQEYMLSCADALCIKKNNANKTAHDYWSMALINPADNREREKFIGTYIENALKKGDKCPTASSIKRPHSNSTTSSRRKRQCIE